jgi:hypothetical protein
VSEVTSVAQVRKYLRVGLFVFPMRNSLTSAVPRITDFSPGDSL